MKFEDLVNSVFEDDISPALWSRSFVPLAGGCWLLSDSVHEMCEILRFSRKEMRLSREAWGSRPDAWKRFAPVKYPPMVYND